MIKKIVCILILMMVTSSCFLMKKDKAVDEERFVSLVKTDNVIKNDTIVNAFHFSTLKSDEDVKAQKLTPLVDKLEKVVAAKEYSFGSISNSGGSGVKTTAKEIRIVEIKNTKIIKQSSDLSEGRIVYKVPDKMKVRSTYKVFVRISKSKAIITMTDDLSGTVMTSVLPVTETMEVKLVDVSPKDRKVFEIVEDNNGAVQLVENGDTYTEWSWDVTPIHVGDLKLKIIVSVIRNGNKKDVVYEDTVTVETDWIVQIRFFIEKHWQILLTSMIIPFGVWYYQNRKKKKNILLINLKTKKNVITL